MCARARAPARTLGAKQLAVREAAGGGALRLARAHVRRHRVRAAQAAGARVGRRLTPARSAALLARQAGSALGATQEHAQPACAFSGAVCSSEETSARAARSAFSDGVCTAKARHQSST